MKNCNETRLKRFIEDNELNHKKSIHGIRHIENVAAFGKMLAKQNGADIDVVIWFAYLHDSQRKNDALDKEHGPNAAKYITTIRNSYLKGLNDWQVLMLKEACCLHTGIHHTGNITIDTCFDADRLDLPRVGIKTNPQKMATELGSFYAMQSYEDNLTEAGLTEMIKFDSLLPSVQKLNAVIPEENLIFQDNFIKTSEESMFAVRFNFINNGGKSFSPFNPICTKKEWDLTAKSVVIRNPTDSLIVSSCNGIFAINYDEFKYGESFYKGFVNHSSAAILLEFSPQDVIMSSKDEIALSQCNILFSAPINIFEQKMADGSIDNMTLEFHAKKKSLPLTTQTFQIARINEKLERFIFASSNMNHRLVLRTIFIGMELIRFCGIGDPVVFSWFAAISSMKCFSSAKSVQIFRLIDTIRKTLLTDLSIKQIIQLQMALSYFTNPNDSKRMEYDIYIDARLMGEKSLQGIEIKTEELRSVMARRFRWNLL